MNIDNISTAVFELIDKSPSAYHVIKNALEQIDAEILHENDAVWDIKLGRDYVVVRNDASAIFFHVPSDIDVSKVRFEIAAAHSDSPCFVVKHDPIVVSNGYVKLNVEEYGGDIRRSWFDRPLSIAGRVLIEDVNDDSSEQQDTHDVHAYLVDLKNKLGCIIPSLAPHLGGSRDGKSDAEISVQKELMPILGTESSFDAPENCLVDAIADILELDYGIIDAQDKIVDWDLFVYANEKATALSTHDIICSPRIDDQGCVWSAVLGFAKFLCAKSVRECDDSNVISTLVIFDNEENGSLGYHAASSTFLVDVLSRVWESLSRLEPAFSRERFYSACARSFMVSADNGHAHHPNYAEKSDPTNEVILGDGIVLKYAANQNYMTNARTGAAFAKICDDNNIAYQRFHNNSDVKGGATLGNISASQMSIPGVDIGLPQLAMHSACECCSADDVESLVEFFESFFAGKRDVNITTSDIICY